MIWTIKYDAGEGYLKVAPDGIFDAGDYFKMLEGIISQECWKPGMSILFDKRRLNFGKSSYEIMRKACSEHERNDARIGAGRIPLLMKSVTDYGMGRQYEILTDGKVSSSLHIFLDKKSP